MLTRIDTKPQLVGIVSPEARNILREGLGRLDARSLGEELRAQSARERRERDEQHREREAIASAGISPRPVSAARRMNRLLAKLSRLAGQVDREAAEERARREQEYTAAADRVDAAIARLRHFTFTGEP